MKNVENFLILINNLSDVYIFTVVTMFSLAAVTLYCSKFMNRNSDVKKVQGSASRNSKKKDKNSDTEDENDEKNRINDPYHQDDSDSGEEMGRDFVREIKTAKLKELEEALTDEQKQEERRIESQQLSAIFELLKKQEEEFNCSSMDENEFKKQLSLYR